MRSAGGGSFEPPQRPQDQMPDGDEGDTEREERPVVHLVVVDHSDVVSFQDQMENDLVDHVEHAPADEPVADKGP